MKVAPAPPDLSRLIAAYEARRAGGLEGVTRERITIDQRLAAEQVLAALHASHADGVRDPLTLYLDHLAPVLAESAAARAALGEALAQVRPPPIKDPNPEPRPTWWQRIVLRLDDRWRTLRHGDWERWCHAAAWVGLFFLAGTVVAVNSDRIGELLELRQSPDPPVIVGSSEWTSRPVVAQTESVVGVSDTRPEERARLAFSWTLHVALEAHRRAREAANRMGRGASPREIAAHQIASRPRSPDRPLEEAQPFSPEPLLAAMLRAAPHPPDHPIPRTAEGLDILRRHVGVAASLLFSLPDALTEPLALGSADLTLNDQTDALLNGFVSQSAPAPALPAPKLEPPARPWLALLLIPPFFVLLGGLIRAYLAPPPRKPEQSAHDERDRDRDRQAGRAADRALRAFMKGEIRKLAIAGQGSRGRSRPLDVVYNPPPAPRAALNRLVAAERKQSRKIDAARSVKALIDSFGAADPVYWQMRRLTGYVFLIHRRSEDDHERHRLRRIIDAVRATGIPVACYDYGNSPLRLRESSSGRRPGGADADSHWGTDLSLSLDQAAGRHPGMRLVLVTDGRELVPPLGRRMNPAIATALKRYFPSRIILTPVPPGDWGATEYVLARDLEAPIGRSGRGPIEAFASGVDDPSGGAGRSALDDLARGFDEGPGARLARQALRSAAGEKDFYAQVMAWLRQMLSSVEGEALFGADAALSRGSSLGFDDPTITLDFPPVRERIGAMVRDLQDWLGPNGFAWHSALAHYPDIRFDLTLKMASELSGLSREDGGVPLVEREDSHYKFTPEAALALQRMGALPWFRAGTWPEWLRQPLLDATDDRTRKAAQRIVLRLFEGTDAPEPDQDAVPVWWPRTGKLRAPRDEVSLQMLAWPGRRAIEEAWREGQRKELDDLAGPARGWRRARFLRSLGLAIGVAAWGVALMAVWPEAPSALNGESDARNLLIMGAMAALCALVFGMIAVIRRQPARKGAVDRPETALPRERGEPGAATSAETESVARSPDGAEQPEGVEDVPDEVERDPDRAPPQRAKQPVKTRRVKSSGRDDGTIS